MKRQKRRRRKPRKLGICYLCGESLNGKGNKDHIPPKQIFPTRARKANLSKLETRYTHKSCNQSYQEDENYFADWMASISDIRHPNIDPRRDVLRRNEKEENEGTAKRKYIKELKEHAKTPIYSPEGYLLIIPQRRESIDRAIWKIIRGLYFIEHQDRTILPENTNHSIGRPITVRNQRLLIPSTFSPEEQILINNLLIALDNRPSMGKYPAIFDYKYDSGSVSQSPQLRKYTWVLILHGSIIIVVNFEAR